MSKHKWQEAVYEIRLYIHRLVLDTAQLSVLQLLVFSVWSTLITMDLYSVIICDSDMWNSNQFQNTLESGGG